MGESVNVPCYISASDILRFLISICLLLFTVLLSTVFTFVYCGPLITFGLPCLCLKRSLLLCLTIYVSKGQKLSEESCHGDFGNRKMKIQCEVCEKAEAEVLCCSDEAVLCKPCDIKVHEANKLFQRHHRVDLQKSALATSPLCDICQERKGYFFCLEDRAVLCNECDGAIHTSNSHQRFLLSGVQASDQSLAENSGCSTSFSSETCQFQSRASLNSQYSSEETEAGHSGEADKIPSVFISP